MKQTRFILPVLLIGIVALFTSCGKGGGAIKGSGPVVKQEFDLPPVSAISLSIDANVILTRGDSQSVMIEGQQNIINNIEKYVTSDGYWNIRYYNSVRNHSGVTIFITTPMVDFVTISGSGSIQSTNAFTDTTNVSLKISGSGSIFMNTTAHIIESSISGSGQINLEGTAFEHRINISGSGDIQAFYLATDNTYVNVSGSGNSEVWATNYLDVIISGSGSVYYKGNPQINVNISGSGGIFNTN
ncbi:MAG: DUF2807 domain-containing protein [Bacteroidales bacterium]|nr:DUF2807 domain-containing protein [Bacteroidales bacterium]